MALKNNQIKIKFNSAPGEWKNKWKLIFLQRNASSCEKSHNKRKILIYFDILAISPLAPPTFCLPFTILILPFFLILLLFLFVFFRVYFSLKLFFSSFLFLCKLKKLSFYSWTLTILSFFLFLWENQNKIALNWTFLSFFSAQKLSQNFN